MAEYVKKLHVKKNGTTEDISLYSTETEAGQSHISVNFYADSAYYLSTGYAKIGNPGDAAASKLRVSSNSLGQNRAVLKRAADMCEITLRCYDVETENQISSVKYSAEKNNYLYLNNINAPQIAEYDFVMMDGVKNLVTSNNNIFNVWYVRKTVPDRTKKKWNQNDLASIQEPLSGFLVNTYSAKKIITTEYFGNIFPKNVEKIKRFNTSNMTSGGNLFNGLDKIKSIPQIDTSNFLDMNYMFYGTSLLKSVPPLNTEKVTDMTNAFSYSGITSIPEMDTENVSRMYETFCNTEIKVIENLNTSSVTEFFFAFSDCKQLTDVKNLDTSKCTSATSIFSSCYKLKNICELDTSKIKNMEGMFQYCTSLTNIPWAIDMSSCTSCTGMFTDVPLEKPVHLKNVPINLEITTSKIGTANFVIDSRI